MFHEARASARFFHFLDIILEVFLGTVSNTCRYLLHLTQMLLRLMLILAGVERVFFCVALRGYKAQSFQSVFCRDWSYDFKSEIVNPNTLYTSHLQNVLYYHCESCFIISKSAGTCSFLNSVVIQARYINLHLFPNIY